MITATTKKGVRKTELRLDEGGQEWLDKIREVFDIEGWIVTLSYDGVSKYGIYFRGIPSISPIDFSGIEVDPIAESLVSVKVDLSDNSIGAKIYRVGNVMGVDFDKPITGTGQYVNSDIFTVYYPTNGEPPDVPLEDLVVASSREGFSGVTFYPDGTTSDESVYRWTEKIKN